MNVAARLRRPPPVVGRSILGVALGIGVVLALLWLAGAFHPKIDASRARGPGMPLPVPAEARLADARIIRVPAVESAVGSVRAQHEAAVASKLLARVVAVNVQAGQRVARGDELVRLDDAELVARARQAAAVVDQARAARDQAQIEFARVQDLRGQQAAARIELERAETELKSAVAALERAEQNLREAETLLSYATIHSPLDGVVIDRQVEPGDTVTPGQVLLRIYDPTRMQLVAIVRESLAQRLAVGQTIGVRLEALAKDCEGVVSEIVPESETASRSFAVKVTGPCPPGVYTGMFGRVLIPLDDEQVLVVPRAAVRRVGQLDIVDVAVADGPGDPPTRIQRRVVQLGRTFGADVEILSGLRAGERVALPAAPPDAARDAGE